MSKIASEFTSILRENRLITGLAIAKTGGLGMDAVTQTENLIKEVERLKSENETLFKTVLQMKQTLDRLIIKYIENGKQEA